MVGDRGVRYHARGGVLHDYVNTVKHRLKLPQLPYLTQNSFSLEDLLNRYIYSVCKR